MEAMFKMRKLDIQKLKQAAKSAKTDGGKRK
jgi:hypothetical protein